MMLFNLCLKNIKKSIKDYSIYFVTLVIAVAIFYIFNSIEAQESMLKLTKQKTEMIKALVIAIGYVSVFVSVILGFLIIYSNNFLIKRRKKEMGLYLTLGMNKRKVSTILVIETLLVGIISLVVGLLMGVGLSQFISVFTVKLFETDMTKFAFVFSLSAMTKTILYFGIIFILVMIFNVISLSRYKLIDLLNAKKKNEKVRVKSKLVTFITFALSMIFLGYAYHILFTDGLLTLDGTTLKMLISGVIGTFLLFLSLSGFFLRIIEINKKLYYRGLNMFILKQINNKVNTTVISTTIISLMLLLTIGILSGSMSLVNVFNTGLKENNLTDFSINVFGYKAENFNTDYIVNNDLFKSSVDGYTSYNLYQVDGLGIDDLLNKKVKAEIKKEYGDMTIAGSVSTMSESDYNKLMKFYNREDLIINIKDDEYLLLANIDQIIKYYTPALKENNIIKIGNTKLHPNINKVINIAIFNSASNGNDGVIVVNDKLLENSIINQKEIVGNYTANNKNDSFDEKFTEELSSQNTSETSLYITTKISMEASSAGVRSIITFLGLYLGIIFAISSATVLAIGQLSESSDNKERYKVLSQIGADNKMIRRSLFIQIGICFMLPLIVAIVHSYFGLRELNSIIKIIGDIDIASNIALMSLFIIVVYGGYFLATYLCSRNIIEEKINR